MRLGVPRHAGAKGRNHEETIMAEQSGEAELAIYVGSKIADGLVGGAATQ